MAGRTPKLWGLTRKSFAPHIQWAVTELSEFAWLEELGRPLTEAELAWFSQFQREYYNNNIKKGDPKAIHNTDALRLTLYRDNKRARRDLLSARRSWVVDNSEPEK